VIDAMTLLDVEELCRYWADYPPLHVLAAAVGGHGRRRRPALERRGADTVVAELGAGFALGDVNAGLPRPALSFEQLRATAA
jgi:hypothetical protein